MLGEQLSEELGQITGLRVLPSPDGLPRVEVCFQTEGTLLGLGVTQVGTYQSVTRPDGTLSGEGQGLLWTTEGDTATFTGQGVGTRDGVDIYWRGAIYYQTASERLARLNGLAAVFEFDIDEASMKVQGKAWEWK